MSCNFDGVHSHQCRSHNNTNAICVVFSSLLFSSLLLSFLFLSLFLLPVSFPILSSFLSSLLSFLSSFVHHPPNPLLPPPPSPHSPSSFPLFCFLCSFIILPSLLPPSHTFTFTHTHTYTHDRLFNLFTLILLSPQPLAVSPILPPLDSCFDTATTLLPFFLFSLVLLTFKTSIPFSSSSHILLHLTLTCHINNRPWLALSNSLRRSLQLGSLPSVDAPPPVENNKLCCIL
ncbi:hypothetical protein BKA57DRAFT_203607 [Linnemannia elongata]|nr:hypothetical protein BKA57DRAFT_203607 [Linnemannia elongata]